jgi:hypothetical protein
MSCCDSPEKYLILRLLDSTFNVGVNKKSHWSRVAFLVEEQEIAGNREFSGA